MSTRARIIIEDVSSGDKRFLYSSADGYLEGLGDDLVTACDSCSGAPDIDSFAFKLLNSDAGLEVDEFGEDACVDWVYTLEWSPAKVDIFAQKVDWNGNVELPVSKRLGERIDVRAFIVLYRENERRHDQLVEELTERCGPCPLCGSQPDVFVSSEENEFRVRCCSMRCAKRKEVQTDSADELVAAWHRLPL